MAAKLMGFDPLDIKFIRLAHELGLGCGDPREIEIVGDLDAAEENWHFVGPFKKMTFASQMQHKIYWGPLKKPIEWSLKTVLAPWAYIATVVYHDMFWYPFKGEKMMADALQQRVGPALRQLGAGAARSRRQGWTDVGHEGVRAGAHGHGGDSAVAGDAQDGLHRSARGGRPAAAFSEPLTTAASPAAAR